MTPTERQRRWRQRLQAQTSEPDGNLAAPPDSPAGEELSEPLAADQARIEKLTRERDEAVRQRDEAWAERNHLRRERDEAWEQRDYALKGVTPNPEVAGDHIRACWCFFCSKRGGDNSQIEIMIEYSRTPLRRTFICSECIERCDEIIAAKRQANPAK
jgi:hypothetical protein